MKLIVGESNYVSVFLGSRFSSRVSLSPSVHSSQISSFQCAICTNAPLYERHDSCDMLTTIAKMRLSTVPVRKTHRNVYGVMLTVYAYNFHSPLTHSPSKNCILI